MGIQSSRTLNITKHIGLSFLFKTGSIVANFMLVPITMNYLDTENYGIWLTISSFIAWFSFFDIGLGNGLRNKFAEAKAKGDLSSTQAYVSTAYFTIGAICVVLIVAFFLVNVFIDWTVVFNTQASLGKDLTVLMPIVFGFFCLQLVVKLITTIYTADQNHSIQGKINFYTQIASLATVWLLTQTTHSTLLLFGMIYTALPVFVLIIYNVVAFSGTYKQVRPKISLWKKQHLNDIFGLGILFFFVQISGIILYTTDNFIISNLFSPAEVVPYTISYKYFGMTTMIFSIISTPYWSSFTEAYYKNDVEWIKHSMKSLKKVLIIFCILIVIMVLLSSRFYRFWVGTEVVIPLNLSILMGVFFLFSLITIPYTMFLNGSGKVRLQAIQGFIAALVNIPLSIFFVKVLHLGVEGVILATVICFIPSLFLSPLQYRKIIMKKATGIWNK